MRKIIRNAGSICPSGYIWIAHIGLSTTTSGQPISKLIFPAGTFRTEAEAAAKAMNTNAKIVNIIEVSIQG
ncbi:hypothetical protein [Campylobacter sp. RM16187]|uniref:hypothetical protein n=1 Tax=Campylobacter sp. RM16187 TaxID=1660063 RepID=UPI0021B659EF|nr:hypothetical protein [Campylobacter sp. RM16187]QKG29196.1 hypothetical protein CDOMF_0933 [Campylobacter sp. RM16187]